MTTADTIRIDVREATGAGSEGLYFATSPDLEGLHLASTNRATIEDEARKMAAAILAAGK